MDEANKVQGTSQEEIVTGDESVQEGKHDLDFILDIPLDITVELGKVKMLVNDLLQIGQGSIVELNKPSGEPVEIYINSKLIARGEVVVVDEKLGIRVTDVISALERVKSLG